MSEQEIETVGRALAIQSSGGDMVEMSIEDVRGRVRKVLELQKEVMKDGIHYGKVPGTDKPTLLKPGAELLCMTFMLNAQYSHVKLQDGMHREIDSICQLVHIPSGRRVGSGEGSCSTYESKYAWRNVGPECPDCAKPLRKSKEKPEWYCWRKQGGCGATFPLTDTRIKAAGRVPNPDLPDTYNTVLKMANKRSLVAAVLNALAASELYTADLEDFQEDISQKREKVAHHDDEDQGGDAVVVPPNGNARTAAILARATELMGDKEATVWFKARRESSEHQIKSTKDVTPEKYRALMAELDDFQASPPEDADITFGEEEQAAIQGELRGVAT